jgi:hypothetical protein
MSIQYSAYQVTEFFIEKIQEKGVQAIDILVNGHDDDYTYEGEEEDIKKLFTEAKNISHKYESMTIDMDGKWMENLHLLLSGTESFQIPIFTISHQLNDREFLLINALTGTHKIDEGSSYLQVSYLCASEVKEAATNLLKVVDEDLVSRWHYCESIAVVRTIWEIDEVKEYLNEELIPFFKRASNVGAGIVVVLS